MASINLTFFCVVVILKTETLIICFGIKCWFQIRTIEEEKKKKNLQNERLLRMKFHKMCNFSECNLILLCMSTILHIYFQNSVLFVAFLLGSEFNKGRIE